ncbi:MAG TPA: recombinase family protein [Solirubrobacteraceae bacterium]|jgi:DNA invertase Pin-like site-specific DNA recombinase
MPNTDKPATQRAVAYVRESTEEQGQGFSPDAQRQTIAKFAQENDLELVGEYCDFHSGWRKSEARPEFQRLMADAAAKRFDVVLVFHTSRFARSQVEARRYKQLLRERLGIRVVSVTQPMGDDPSDPSAFLAESIHEMFDEYYSVSLSFWTRSGLREKARQGHLLGILPWGYERDPQTKLAIPHSERAPLVLGMFERYATGQESDRTIADWLNAKGARTARNRPFGKDTVREMLCNAAYAGYVSGLRDKSRAIKGLHETIVPEELFDRVQEIRSWRTRVLKPGRPSRGVPPQKAPALRALRRTDARHPRITRRHPPLPVLHPPLPRRLPADHRQSPALGGAARDMALRFPARRQTAPARHRHHQQQHHHAARPGPRAPPRAAYPARAPARPLRPRRPHQAPLHLRRQAIEEELQRLAPPTTPDLDRAQELLGDFKRFWDAEPDPGGASSSRASSSTSGRTTARSSPSNPAPPSPTTSPHSTKPSTSSQKPAQKAG